MDTDDIIPMLVVGAFVLIGVLKQIFSSGDENGEDKSNRRPLRQRRNLQQRPQDATYPYPQDSDNDEAFNDARKFVEELKRRSSNLQNEEKRKSEWIVFENEELDSELDGHNDSQGKIVPKKIANLETKTKTREHKVKHAHAESAALADKLSIAVSSLEESERILNAALEKSQSDAYSQEKMPEREIGNDSGVFEIFGNVRASDSRRKRLQEAFVMSEILAKPVALRGTKKY